MSDFYFVASDFSFMSSALRLLLGYDKSVLSVYLLILYGFVVYVFETMISIEDHLNEMVYRLIEVFLRQFFDYAFRFECRNRLSNISNTNVKLSYLYANQ